MASVPSSKPARILACVLCQHRKIKCDRTFPCANCVKANCKCVPSTPAPVRKRRRPNQDLQERLARCEQLLKEYATEKPEGEPSPEATPLQAQTTPPALNALRSDVLQPAQDWKPMGKLIKEGGEIRFMDSYLLGTIYDELRAMKDIIDSEEPEDMSTESYTPDDNSDLLFGADTPSNNVEELYPDAGHIFRLWQVYLDRVNPLLKIIHVPSVQPYLVEAASGASTIPKSVEALLFSIYLMATVSLSPNECQGLLGYSREDALARFSQGTRLSLIRMGFLKSHDLATLQALVNYQTSLQGRYNRHAAWVLDGVVIRIAQKLGLHRDGEILGLSPFETEMRRRVWWQIIMMDAKYAIFSGMGQSLLPRGWDTKQPKNVNDADLFPSATEPVFDRDGPTEMIFCIIGYKAARFMVEYPGFEAMMLMHQLGSTNNPNAPGAAEVERFKQTLRVLTADLVEAIDKYCDPSAGPLHEMAMGMKSHILEKMNQILSPPSEKPDWTTELRTPQDNAFMIAVDATCHNIEHYDETKDKGFLWFSLNHFQPDLFVFLCGQLCLRTEGHLVEKAWEQVQKTFDYHPELYDTSVRTYNLLGQYILKAWRRREQVLIARTGQVPETPDYIIKMRRTMPQEDSRNDSISTDIDRSPATLMTANSLISPSQLTKSPPGVQATELAMDGLLGSGGYVDVASLDWDMWSNINPTAMNAGQAFGTFGMGSGRDWQ